MNDSNVCNMFTVVWIVTDKYLPQLYKGASICSAFYFLERKQGVLEILDRMLLLLWHQFATCLSIIAQSLIFHLRQH